MAPLDSVGGKTVSAKAGSFDLLLTVAPGRPGTNTLHLAVTSGGDPTDVMEVTLRLGRPDLGIQEITRLMQRVGRGQYRLEGPELAVAGTWRLRIDLLVSDFDKQSAEMFVPIGSASGTHLH
jgi:copper transport protein